MDLKFMHASGRPIRSLSLIIPFYNEEEAIGQLREHLDPVLARLEQQLHLQLILVDDGSTDQTYSLLQEHFQERPGLELSLLRHPRNRGLGAAMRTGLQAAHGDAICTLDSDCTYAPEGLIGMIKLMEEGGGDIVTASPYHPSVPQEGQPPRIFLSKAVSHIYALLVPVRLYCYTSVFRLYRRAWARPDSFASDDFLGVTEILLSAAYCGATILEYPAHLSVRRLGRSKMRTLQVICDHLSLIWKTMQLNARIHLSRFVPARSDGLEEDPSPPLYPVDEEMTTLLSQWIPMGRVEYQTSRPALRETVQDVHHIAVSG